MFTSVCLLFFFLFFVFNLVFFMFSSLSFVSILLAFRFIFYLFFHTPHTLFYSFTFTFALFLLFTSSHFYFHCQFYFYSFFFIFFSVLFRSVSFRFVSLHTLCTVCTFLTYIDIDKTKFLPLLSVVCRRLLFGGGGLTCCLSFPWPKLVVYCPRAYRLPSPRSLSAIYPPYACPTDSRSPVPCHWPLVLHSQTHHQKNISTLNSRRPS